MTQTLNLLKHTRTHWHTHTKEGGEGEGSEKIRWVKKMIIAFSKGRQKKIKSEAYGKFPKTEQV